MQNDDFAFSTLKAHFVCTPRKHDGSSSTNQRIPQAKKINDVRRKINEAKNNPAFYLSTYLLRGTTIIMNSMMNVTHNMFTTSGLQQHKESQEVSASANKPKKRIKIDVDLRFCISLFALKVKTGTTLSFSASNDQKYVVIDNKIHPPVKVAGASSQAR